MDPVDHLLVGVGDLDVAWQTAAGDGVSLQDTHGAGTVNNALSVLNRTTGVEDDQFGRRGHFDLVNDRFTDIFAECFISTALATSAHGQGRGSHRRSRGHHQYSEEQFFHVVTFLTVDLQFVLRKRFVVNFEEREDGMSFRDRYHFQLFPVTAIWTVTHPNHMDIGECLIGLGYYAVFDIT
ncbi:hypothetical protein D3C80_1345060 [compost metagenome]